VLTHQREPHNVARYFYIDEFFDDARGAEEEFPQFSLVEPAYTSFAENDDHPPHDIMRSQKLIADVYNAIRANDALWKSTLLVIFYDEHGGFYDHVEPPAAILPDDHHDEYSFDQLGVRVPALLVSPWVDARVEHTVFDHTSVLRYLSDKWGLGPLGRRTAGANSVAVALTRHSIREDVAFPIELSSEQLRPPDPADEERVFGYASAHQTGPAPANGIPQSRSGRADTSALVARRSLDRTRESRGGARSRIRVRRAIRSAGVHCRTG
jgi:phospholipase C